MTPIEIRIEMKDGVVFNWDDIRAWAAGDLSSIGLSRREPRIIRELARIVVEQVSLNNSFIRSTIQPNP